MNLHVNCTVQRIWFQIRTHQPIFDTAPCFEPIHPTHRLPLAAFGGVLLMHTCSCHQQAERPSRRRATPKWRRGLGAAGCARLATVENPELREELLRVEPELARESPELRTPCRLARTAAAHGRWPSGVRFRNVGDGTSSSSGRHPHVYPVRISALGSGAPLATASRPTRPVMGSRLQSGHLRACRC